MGFAIVGFHPFYLGCICIVWKVCSDKTCTTDLRLACAAVPKSLHPGCPFEAPSVKRYGWQAGIFIITYISAKKEHAERDAMGTGHISIFSHCMALYTDPFGSLTWHRKLRISGLYQCWYYFPLPDCQRAFVWTFWQSKPVMPKTCNTNVVLELPHPSLQRCSADTVVADMWLLSR